MAFVDSTQPGQDQDENESQVDQATNPNPSNAQASAQAGTPAQPSTSAGGGSSGVASAGSPGGGGGGPAPASPQKPSSSGSWTNLNQYLGANQDQATGIGNQIAQTVNTAGQTAQNDVGNLSSNFKNQVDQNTVNTDWNAINGAVGDATSATAGGTLNPTDVSNFQKQADASYNGPKDLTQAAGYSQAQQDISNATDLAGQTTTESGRAALLNNQYANTSPTGYTQGENNLDQLLLENSSGAQAALNPLQGEWSGLNAQLGGAVTQGATEAQAGANTTAATSQNATNALGTATQGWENNISTGLTNLQNTDTAAYNQTMADLQNGQLSPQDYTNLQLNPSVHNYLAAPGALSTYASALPSTEETLSNYATTDQYAQAAALAQLAGQPGLSGDYSTLNSTNLANVEANPSDAFTANTAPVTFNGNQYYKDNNTAQGEYQNASNNIIGQITNPATNMTGYNASMVNDLPSAVNWLNSVIQQNTSAPNQISASEIAWAKQQLAQINQLQNQYGFNPYSVGTPGRIGSAGPV